MTHVADHTGQLGVEKKEEEGHQEHGMHGEGDPVS